MNDARPVPGRDGPAAMKAASNRSHARRRAFERYGIDLSDGEIAGMEAPMRAGGKSESCVPLMTLKSHRTRVLHAVKHDGRWLPVVWDTSTGSIITFLPIERLAAWVNFLSPVSVPSPPAASSPRAAPRAVGFWDAVRIDDRVATDADYKAAIAAVAARRNAVDQMRRGFNLTTDERAAFQDEFGRLVARYRELKRRKHEALMRRQVEMKAIRDGRGILG